jgi:glycosyltransferase involved in cell wall biosynthesis
VSAVPRISVVLIFLDAARYLDEAISSVAAQTLPDWELLLVDDGSTDGSTAIARRWVAARPTCVHYLEHEGHHNLGMSAARNLGLRHGRADVVTFLDADDVLRPSALETLLARLEEEPSAAMAYGPPEYWFSWTPTPVAGASDFLQPLGVPSDAVIPPPRLLTRFLRRRAAVPSGMVVRTEIARAVGGFEEEFRGMYEDQAFCAKICLRWPVATTGISGYRYRQHPDSSTALAQRTLGYDLGRDAFLRWLGQYLAGQDAADGPVGRALRSELWWLRHPRLHGLAGRMRQARRRLAARMRPAAATRPAHGGRP